MPSETPPLNFTAPVAPAEEPQTSTPSHLNLKGWNAMFHSLELSMFVKQVFSEFEFLNFENKIVTLKKSDDLINPTEGLKTEFIEALAKRLGSEISLVIESGDVASSPAAMEELEVKQQLDEDKAALLENPVLKDILESFDGKIIDESVNKVTNE